MAGGNGSVREGTIPLGATVSTTTLGAVADLAALMESADDPKSAIELRERMAEVELALEDLGWVRMGWETQGQLSRSGLRKLTTICRQLYLKHPLINHAINVQTNYVWGQGVAVVAKSAEINGVFQAWWDLRENKAELTGHRARMLKEKELGVAGNVFLALFTDPTRGTVRVRSIEVEEVEQIVSNPDDRREPWFYHRKWQQADGYDLDSGLATGSSTIEAYYPDWLYRPASRPSQFEGQDIKWDSPVYHMKVGGLDNMRFGVPEIFPAIDWARAVQQDLENYATVRKALAKFAFNLTVKGSPQTVAAARAMLQTTVGSDTSSGEHNPPPVAGSTLIQREGSAKMEPIRTAGMQPSPDEGRRLGLMVSAGTGIPETMLWGDATLGNYATAKSLDRPTELQMTARQQDWVDTFTDLAAYVLDASGLAPKGQLKAKKVTDDYSGADVVLILDRKTGKPLDRRIDVAFPPILEHDAAEEVQAIATARTMNGQGSSGLIDERTIARLLLVALRVNNVDEVLARTHPDEPNPPAVDPGSPAPPPSPPTAGGPPAPGSTPGAPPPTNAPDAAPASVPDTPAATEAYRRLAEVAEAIGKLSVLPSVDVPALVAQMAEALRPNLEPFAAVLRNNNEAIAAVAGRPIAVEVVLPESKARTVRRETKFLSDEKGHITGKTETEEEV